MKSGFFNNPWKFAFFVLLALVLAAVFTLVSCWLYVTHPKQSMASPAAPISGGVPIQAVVPMKSINQFVDLQLAGKQTPVQDAELTMEPDTQRLRMNAALTFFGRALEMVIWFKPHVLADGNLSLVAADAKMGQWPIPMKTLFAVLEGLPWPPWVHVHAEQHTIDFNITEKPSTNNTHYKIQKIDWVKQALQLQVLVGTTPGTSQK